MELVLVLEQLESAKERKPVVEVDTAAELEVE